MELGNTKIEAGAVCFALQYRALMPDQGVSLQVVGEVDGHPAELLRFDCFDQNPHYHYDPEGRNERHSIDKTTAGNPVGCDANADQIVNAADVSCTVLLIFEGQGACP